LTLFRVTVTPEGRVQDCTIETTSGVPELDKLTCERVMQRARFRPAKWPDGTPAYDVYRRSVLWADLAAFKYSNPVDVEIKVSRMPKGVRAPVNLAVDANGRRSSCEAPDRAAHPTLVSLACQQILANYPAIPARNEAGVKVPSIQNATVSFVAD
jgi:TonB family protein